MFERVRGLKTAELQGSFMNTEKSTCVVRASKEAVRLNLYVPCLAIVASDIRTSPPVLVKLIRLVKGSSFGLKTKVIGFSQFGVLVVKKGIKIGRESIPTKTVVKAGGAF